MPGSYLAGILRYVPVLPLAGSPARRHDPAMQIDIIIFDGFDELDAIGPYEVLRNAADFGAPFEVTLVGAHGAATITASHGTRIVVERGPSETADVVLVPGGGYLRGTGIRHELERGELPRVVAAAHERGAIVGSVCTGAMVLAASGLAAGRRMTTHRLAIDDLRAAGAEVVEARFTDDGDIVSSGGVTSGIHLALHLVERFADAEIAERVAQEIEHELVSTAP
jgi:transcriptional regulator GlxA family with amidase domain